MSATWTTGIQWKGTDLCMDFNCPKCGTNSHFDGFFAYVIRCPKCRTCYEMPTDVPVKEIPEPSDATILDAWPEDA